MLNRSDLIYPELSYKIIGCAYEVFNSIGGGHKEIVYQKAMDIAFKRKRNKQFERAVLSD